MGEARLGLGEAGVFGPVFVGVYAVEGEFHGGVEGVKGAEETGGVTGGTVTEGRGLRGGGGGGGNWWNERN